MGSGKGKDDKPKSSTKDDEETASAPRELNFKETTQTTGTTAKEQAMSVEEKSSVNSNAKRMKSAAIVKPARKDEVVATSSSSSTEQKGPVETQGSNQTAETTIETEKSPTVGEMTKKFGNKNEKKAAEKAVPISPVTPATTNAEAPAPSNAEPRDTHEMVHPSSETKEAVISPIIVLNKDKESTKSSPNSSETKQTPVEEPVVEVQKTENGGNAPSKQPESQPTVADKETRVEEKSETSPLSVEETVAKTDEAIPPHKDKAAPTSQSSSQGSPVVVDTAPELEQQTDKEQLDDGNWVTVDAAKTREDEENQATSKQDVEGTAETPEASSTSATNKPSPQKKKGPGAPKNQGKRSNKKKNKSKKKK